MTEAELEKYYDELLDLARRVFGADKIAAEDVVSDTILLALSDIRAGKSIENPAAYLKTLFYRRKSDFFRRKYRDSCVIFDDGSRLSLIPERNFRENSRLEARQAVAFKAELYLSRGDGAALYARRKRRKSGVRIGNSGRDGKTPPEFGQKIGAGET